VNRKNLPRLRHRILNQPTNSTRHAAAELTPAGMGQYHPAPPQEQVMPMTIVIMTADTHQVAEAWPLYAGPRGAPIPATGPGQWVQVHAAGRA
jgi:hypothetical protein